VKFIGSEVGRFALLFPWAEIRPLHGSTIALSVAALAERYKFQFLPDLNRPWKEVEGTTLELREGYLDTSEARIAIMELNIYSDGMSVQCTTTEDAELVVSDMLKWAQESQGYRPFVRPPLKLFYSQVVVHFQRPLEGLFAKWGAIQKLLNESIKERSSYEPDEQLLRLAFKCDPMTSLHADLTSQFLIEKRVGELFSEQRYFCTAPVPTKEHLVVLERLEALA
jgi:hypothetical protein